MKRNIFERLVIEAVLSDLDLDVLEKKTKKARRLVGRKKRST